MRITSVYPINIAGRNVFAKANLPTPHIPPPVYHYLRQKCLAILSTLYVRASSPPDSPEKSSHQQIDILVSSPVDPEHPPTPAVLSSALSSVMTAKWNSIDSFAVPYPDKRGIFALVDVGYSLPSLFDWSLVHRSYGDLWNILDASIRIFGLTVNERGLFLRIHEIEAVSPRQSLFFLTRKLDDVLQFMGLDVAEYRAGWTRLEDMFAFLARNRFMTKSAYERQEVNANDREKKPGRDVYGRFVNDWLPGWDNGGGRGSGGGTFRPQVGEEGSKGWTGDQTARRAAVLQEALDRFCKQADYDTKMVQWRQKNKIIRKIQPKYIRKGSPIIRYVQKSDFHSNKDAFARHLHTALKRYVQKSDFQPNKDVYVRHGHTALKRYVQKSGFQPNKDA